MSYKFHGGIHPPAFKTFTQDRPAKKAAIPNKVVIPLSQHAGSPAEPVVKVGDAVGVGSAIAKAAGFISSPVHASINGAVTKISYCPTPTQGRALCITIESRGGDQAFRGIKRNNVDLLSKDELLNIIRDSGIVGLGGAAFPTHVKLSPPKDKLTDSLIINGAECEPYLTCDHQLMLDRAGEILKGIMIIAKILTAKNVYIAIEDNKASAIYAMEKALSTINPRPSAFEIRIVALKTVYPQGAEKHLIKSVLNRVVPSGGLPMDVGCVVQNVGTAFSIYEAVYLGKPLIERIVTIAGDCVKEPLNLWVRIGTLVGDLANSLGGFVKEPRKVVIGGPMMGVAQYTMDVPVIKGTGGILFLSADLTDESKEGVCIRCGKCIEACPMKMVPTTLMYRVKLGNFKEAKDLGIMNCCECGSCAYVCPARIPLLDYMKFGKVKA